MGAGLVCGWSPDKAGGSLRTLQSAAASTKAAGGVLCCAPRWCSSPSRADSSGGRSKGFRILGMAVGRAEGPSTRSGVQSVAESGSGTASSACSPLPRALSPGSRIPKEPVSEGWGKAESEPEAETKMGTELQLHAMFLQIPHPALCLPLSHSVIF